MKELSLNEVQEVSGGNFWGNMAWGISWYAGGKLLDHFIFNDRALRGLIDNVENANHRYPIGYGFGRSFR